MLNVYYPYKREMAVWDELRYSLRSLDMFLKVDFRVWIVGDKPDWICGVEHVDYRSDYKGGECCLVDTNSKLLRFLRTVNVGWMLRMMDDVYLMREATMEELRWCRVLVDYAKVGRRDERLTIWRRQVYRTMDVLRSYSFGEWNTETHCGELWDIQRMKEVFDYWQPIENRLLPSSLYWNVMRKEVGVEHLMLRKDDDQRVVFYPGEREFGVEARGNVLEVEKLVEGKLFLNHNNGGLNDSLKRFLKYKFPKKSRFEI